MTSVETVGVDPEVGLIVTTVTMGNGVGMSVVMREMGEGVGKSVGEGVSTQITGTRDAGGGTHGPV